MNPIRGFFTSNPSHIFHGLDQAHQDRMLSCATEREFAAGEYVFRAGDRATHFYLIYIGEIAIRIPGYERGDSSVQSLSTGQVLGISWMMEPFEYRFDAVAVEPSRVLAFDAAALRAQFTDDYRFGYELLLRFTTAIARRLEAARLQMREMARESGAPTELT